MMQSNFFNPEKMISNTSQKIVIVFLYVSLFVLGGGCIGFSLGLIDENMTIQTIVWGMMGTIICIGIWWHEISKPETRCSENLPKLNKDEFISFDEWRQSQNHGSVEQCM